MPQEPLYFATLASAQPQYPAYQAPMRFCNEQVEKLVPGNYIVELLPGYSFEDHCRRVGNIIKERHLKIYRHMFSESIGYSCGGVGDDLLRDIRADIGVKQVYCVPEGGVELEHEQKHLELR